MGEIENELARIAGSATLSDFGESAVASAKRAIADTFAVGVAGRATEQYRSVASLVGPTSSPSGALASRTSGAMADAALLGGVACHALDWDDFMLPMYGHCSTVLLPVAWAVTWAHDMTGRDLLEAYLVGYQVDYLASRFFAGEDYARGWHSTSTVGVLGAAAAASRLLELDERTTGHALGIASSMAGGLRANFGTGTKALHAGIAARDGVQAALLACHGLTAGSDWLVGRFGMLDTFTGRAPSAAEATSIWEKIDHTLHGLETASGLNQKRYTCCGSCHPALDGVVELAERTRAAGRTVHEIEVHVAPTVTDIMRFAKPTTTAEANYSVPWAVAAAAVDLGAGPAQFSDAALRRADIRGLLERVVVVSDMQNSDSEPFAARVRVSDGSSWRETAVSQPLGHPSNPLSAQQLREKQHEALDLCLGSDRADKLIELLEGIDEQDLSVVTDCLRG